MFNQFKRMVRVSTSKTEAEIVADIRSFILEAPLQLQEDNLTVELESPVGNRQRIDIQVGSTVIEVKRNLESVASREAAEDQLFGYLDTRTRETGCRYVGLLTDGRNWICYHAIGASLAFVSKISLGAGNDDAIRLCEWLDGVLATSKGIPATAEKVQRLLGFESPAHELDRETVRVLYDLHKDEPTVVMKRRLWARLLASALGSQFRDDDELFIEHTLLVNSAEIIAHAVLGLDIKKTSPVSLLTGSAFDESGIFGVVDADFFDWVLEVKNGENFVRTLAARLDRFDWSIVDQDILKVLYESIIPPTTRKSLGEYYTPDWLARRIVQETIDDPLNQRVLDPACGSGTFLFFAIKHFLNHAKTEKISSRRALRELTTKVIGTDLHPVAVTLARVTYVLAIGREWLNQNRGDIQIPVYLGDSLQWQEQNNELFNADLVVINTDDKKELLESQLKFPISLLEDAQKFDRLVVELADFAAEKNVGVSPVSLDRIFQRTGTPMKFMPVIKTTFETMRKLHRQGRNHIWGYYIRNLARPMWLAREANRVDILIGNPPWLAYRFMSPSMKKTFRQMSQARALWLGKTSATHQDLSSLFLVRSCELYLKKEGKFAFVLPCAALDREYYVGLRSGEYGDASGGLKLSFEKPWDLRKVQPAIFPRASCVLFGSQSSKPRPLPKDVAKWSGKASNNSSGDKELIVSSATLNSIDRSRRSAYSKTFMNGAILSPRVLFHVEELDAPEKIGFTTGQVKVVSARSQNEKPPWTKVRDIEGMIESTFVKRVVNGNNLFPFQVAGYSKAVLPVTKRKVLKTEDDRKLYPLLEARWYQIENVWKNQDTSGLTLIEQIDYRSKLSNQLPITERRLVYPVSGANLCAAKLEDSRCLVQSGLNWTGLTTDDEADYLIAILNSTKMTELVKPFMAFGQSERHFGNDMWQVGIPTFEETDPVHMAVVRIGRELEKLAKKHPPDLSKYFATERTRIRKVLAATEEMDKLNQLVEQLVG